MCLKAQVHAKAQRTWKLRHVIVDLRRSWTDFFSLHYTDRSNNNAPPIAVVCEINRTHINAHACVKSRGAYTHHCELWQVSRYTDRAGQQNIQCSNPDRRNTFLSPQHTPTLGPTQSSTRCVPGGGSFLGLKRPGREANSPPPSAKVRNESRYLPGAWRDNFTHTLQPFHDDRCSGECSSSSNGPPQLMAEVLATRQHFLRALRKLASNRITVSAPGGETF